METPELWGWIIVLSAIFFLIFYWRKNSRIGLIVFSAFFLRLIAAVTNRYFFTLPAGRFDANAFERLAYQWSQLEGPIFWEMFVPMSAWNFSWFGAWVYKIFGRSEFLLQVFVVIGGTLCVYLTYKVACLITQKKIAYKIAWFAALFPSSIHYSAVNLREVPIILFSLIGIYFLIRWTKSQKEIYFFLGILGFVFSLQFHSAYVIAVLVIIYILIFPKNYAEVKRYSPSWVSSAIFVLLIVGGVIASGGIKITGFGNLLGLFEAEKITRFTGASLENRADGAAYYLQWLSVGNPLDFIWQAPIRLVYLLFTPFPWQIRSPSHIIGIVDSLFYYWMFYQIYKYRTKIFYNKQLMLVFAIAVTMLIVYSFGTSNFGTAIRHRAKFALFLMIISLIPYYENNTWRIK